MQFVYGCPGGGGGCYRPFLQQAKRAWLGIANKVRTRTGLLNTIPYRRGQQAFTDKLYASSAYQCKWRAHCVESLTWMYLR